MRLLKYSIILGSLALAVFFLCSRVGTSIPSLKYKDFELTDIPIGFGFLVFAVAIARFWKIEIYQKKFYKRVITDPDGSKRIVWDTDETHYIADAGSQSDDPNRHVY